MSIHSNDREPRQTKLERLSKRAAIGQDTVFNNLGHILDETLLKEVYHKLDGSKAIGTDGVTKGIYAKNLDSNIHDLLKRIRTGTYRPKAARQVEIPKEDGSSRPLVISCFEDKLVQAAVNNILNAIYEPTFLECSYGFRPNKSCHDAIRALYKHTYPFWNGAVVEIDIKQYFNTIPHLELEKLLKKKIADERFLRLISKLIKAPVMGEKGVSISEAGCPQGSILSPILANLYLHDVIDIWFKEISKKCFKRRTAEIRYADDMVFAFESYADAKRFFKVLPKRLEKYGLKMHENKSQLIRSGQRAAKTAHMQGTRLPTYQFLGFTIYWGKARNGKWWRMKFRSRRDRFSAKLRKLRDFLRKKLTTKDTRKTLETVVMGVKGWLNYHAVSDNANRIRGFIRASRRLIWQWFNRRGRKRPISWATLMRILAEIKFPSSWKLKSMFPKAC